jgi:hypothetical protein
LILYFFFSFLLTSLQLLYSLSLISCCIVADSSNDGIGSSLRIEILCFVEKSCKDDTSKSIDSTKCGAC